ncbi:MAG: hypothetical protein U9N77_01040 [Thermodesulfobacteriota bacterium]|nr:hypothetical protein [Thermodesulfobacteriota bacterium]
MEKTILDFYFFVKYIKNNHIVWIIQNHTTTCCTNFTWSQYNEKNIFFLAFAIVKVILSPVPAISSNVYESFTYSSGGFSTNLYFKVSNNRFHFYGNGSDSSQFIVWDGGTNPLCTWYPEPNHSNYFINFNVSVNTLWEDGAENHGYGLIICT